MIIETGLTIAAIACAMGDVLAQDALTSDSGAWMTTRGEWSFSDAGLGNVRGAENRIFADLLAGHADYAVEFDATLHKDKGWGVWLSAGVGPGDKVSGYSFQYDPGWSDSYLLRTWIDNKESVLLATDLDTDYGQPHHFRLEVAGDSFSAFQDGQQVLSYASLDGRAGDLIGFRTWAQSFATFSDLVVTSVPAPSAASVALGALGLAVCVRRR